MQQQPQILYDYTWWELAAQRSVVRRGIAYTAGVGAVLIAINHGDESSHGKGISKTSLVFVGWNTATESFLFEPIARVRN